MSGPVDVLAVLDDVIADMGDLPGTQGRQLAQARGVVADLIAALRLIESAKDRGFGIDYARGVVQAALARCNGGAA